MVKRYKEVLFMLIFLTTQLNTRTPTSAIRTTETPSAISTLTPLMAVNQGNIDYLREKLHTQKRRLFKWRSPKRETLLHIAVQKNQYAIVKLFIDNEFPLNIQNIYGQTALFEALKTNDLDILEILATAGANLTLKTNDGYTPLFWAVENNNLKKAHILLKAGAPATTTKGIYLATSSLQHAAINGHLAMVLLLLHYNADPASVHINSLIEQRSSSKVDNKTNYHLTIIYHLIKALQSSHPLHFCVENYDERCAARIIIYLLSLKKTFPLYDAQGASPVQVAISERRSSSFIAFLIDMGLPIEGSGTSLPTLHRAVHQKDPLILLTLLAKGAKLNRQNSKMQLASAYIRELRENLYYYPLLHFFEHQKKANFVAKKAKKLIKLLKKPYPLHSFLDHKKHPNDLLFLFLVELFAEKVKTMRNEYNETPFFIALRRHNIYATKFFLEHNNIDPNQQDLYGNRPLHYLRLYLSPTAKKNKLLEKLLIWHGADKSAKNFAGIVYTQVQPAKQWTEKVNEGAF